MNKDKNKQTVSVKYIKGGKEIIYYDESNGRCWIERVIGDKVTIIKEFQVKL